MTGPLESDSKMLQSHRNVSGIRVFLRPPETHDYGLVAEEIHEFCADTSKKDESQR
jgi:hypothetical protein